MDLRDARRLGVTCLLLSSVLVLWLVLLALDDAALFEWAWPTDALATLSLQAWMWIGVGTLLVVALGLVGVVFAMGLGGRAPTRQVQCGECKAVFFIPDNGRRPLMHTCPNCKALGVYEGGEAKAEALEEGKSTTLPTRSFKCPSCATGFTVEDTGVRPLRISCPSCATSGVLR